MAEKINFGILTFFQKGKGVDKPMLKAEEHETIRSLKKIHPDLEVVSQDDVLVIAQKDQSADEFFVVPAQPQKSYDAFTRKDTFSFLGFMHALGYVTQEANKSIAFTERATRGVYEASMDIKDNRVEGYAARIKFALKNEPNSMMPSGWLRYRESLIAVHSM